MVLFPKEWQLNYFFGCEPELTDHEIPWCYNHLRFKARVGNDEVICEIEPSEERVKFRWYQAGRLSLKLDLNWVRGMEVTGDINDETLRLYFRDSNLLPLSLKLNPAVSVEWGTTKDIP